MHSSLRILLLLPALAGWAAADLPRKAPITKYTGLWTNSPFTSKPPPPEAGPVVDPLEDYVLGGVSPIAGGYRVTLFNKKKADERIVVDSDKPSGGFKILSVTRKPGDPLGTVVRMASGSVTGNVSFDQATLKLTPPPAAAAPKPNFPPGVQPQPQPGAQPGQPVLRQPRPRVVPPPTSGVSQSHSPSATPQAPSQRPDRRR